MIKDTSSQDRVVARSPKKRRWTIWGLALVVLIIGGLMAYPSVKRWTAADLTLDAARLNFAQVTRGDLVRALAVEGRIVASSYPTLYAPAQGKVSLMVKPGDPVAEGQVLANLDSPELRNRLLQESSEVGALEAAYARQKIATRSARLRNRQDVDLGKLRLDAAERGLVRAKRTFEQGLMSEADYEKAADDLAEAKLAHKHAVEEAQLDNENMTFEENNQAARLERGRLVLEELKRRVDELTLTSPVNGVVGSLLIDPRDLVNANQPLMTVIDLSVFEIEIRIPESYADEIQPGIEATITFDNRTFKGMVGSVAPEVTNAVVLGTIVFSDSLPEDLKQNQRVSAQILMESRPDVLKVRRGAFLESGGGHLAWVVKGDLAVRTTIRTHTASLTEVEITDGLQAGDTIIISDTSQFEDAATILLRR